MSTTTQSPLSKLEIPPGKRSGRKSGPVVIIGVVIGVLVVGLIVYAMTRKADNKHGDVQTPPPSATPTPAAPAKPGDAVLTVSGYVIPRERIEISPKFQGTVKSIGIKKGDVVKKGEVLVQLEDDEYRARLLEAQGRVAQAAANLKNAEVNLKRQQDLASSNVDSARALDDAIREHDAAAAEVTGSQGTLALAQTYLDWCTIRAPIDGTVLEKLVNPNELVVPQSFGGTRGPSTAFLAMADLSDLQVEIDLNESDTPKVHLNQKCRVSPEAYPDKKYTGHVAEIAPEANRSKGTLQVKVQVENPDKFLTPELSAKVDFLAD